MHTCNWQRSGLASDMLWPVSGRVSCTKQALHQCHISECAKSVALGDGTSGANLHEWRFATIIVLLLLKNEDLVLQVHLRVHKGGAKYGA